MAEIRGPEAIVADVLAGVGPAWQELWTAIEPRLRVILRRPGLLGRLARNEDDVGNIVVDVLGALQENHHSRLRSFVEAKRENPALSFWSWLNVVARRRAIDYMRRQKEFIDRRREENASEKGAWQQVIAVGSDSRLPGARPPLTDLGTARELLAYAGHELTPAQLAALERWLAGRNFDEIAADLALDGARAAERTVRAALERMRRHFRTHPAS